jgi:hypothetical protein
LASIPQPKERGHGQVRSRRGATDHQTRRSEHGFGALQKPQGGGLAVVGGGWPGVLGRQAVVDAHHSHSQGIGQDSVPGIASGCRAEVEAPAVNVEVGGPGLAPSGGDDSHRDLAAARVGDAINGSRIGGPACQHAPCLLQALRGGWVGLRLNADRRCLYRGVEGATLLEVSGRSLVDQVRKPDFHDAPSE